MREIKYRGKVKWNGNHFFAGDWVEGFYAYKELTDEHVILVERANMNRPGSYFTEAEVIPETVGQSTGLKDKNGKEIFEGDIVKCLNGDFFEKGGVVKFGDGTSMFYIYQGEGCKRPLLQGWKGNAVTEIIGNIDDNPELAEVQK